MIWDWPFIRKKQDRQFSIFFSVHKSYFWSNDRSPGASNDQETLSNIRVATNRIITRLTPDTRWLDIEFRVERPQNLAAQRILVTTNSCSEQKGPWRPLGTLAIMLD
jgi:hypothetical protein